MNESTTRQPDLSGVDHAPKVRSVREVASSELLCGETELLIRHGDELYRLKLTRSGKLILQK